MKKKIKEIVKKLKKINPSVVAISVYDDKSLEAVKKILNGMGRIGA